MWGVGFQVSVFEFRFSVFTFRGMFESGRVQGSESRV